MAVSKEPYIQIQLVYIGSLPPTFWHLPTTAITLSSYNNVITLSFIQYNNIVFNIYKAITMSLIYQCNDVVFDTTTLSLIQHCFWYNKAITLSLISPFVFFY